MLVVGDREQEAKLVAVRHRDAGDQGSSPLSGFIAALEEEIKLKNRLT